jgi:hypothetical protein
MGAMMRWMQRLKLADFCFITGASAALVGIGLGIHMGLAQDFTLTPVHVHINLLGWVSMMLFGLYYRGATVNRLARMQAGMAATGFIAMTGGLWLHLIGRDAIGMPMTIAASLLVAAAMVLFLIVLLRARPAALAQQRDPATFAADT